MGPIKNNDFGKKLDSMSAPEMKSEKPSPGNRTYEENKHSIKIGILEIQS